MWGVTRRYCRCTTPLRGRPHAEQQLGRVVREHASLKELLDTRPTLSGHLAECVPFPLPVQSSAGGGLADVLLRRDTQYGGMLADGGLLLNRPPRGPPSW